MTADVRVIVVNRRVIPIMHGIPVRVVVVVHAGWVVHGFVFVFQVRLVGLLVEGLLFRAGVGRGEPEKLNK